MGEGRRFAERRTQTLGVEEFLELYTVGCRRLLITATSSDTFSLQVRFIIDDPNQVPAPANYSTINLSASLDAEGKYAVLADLPCYATAVRITNMGPSEIECSASALA